MVELSTNELWERIKQIRDNGGGNIRVHPNGFIQVDLESVEENWHASHKRGHSGAGVRLHVWNPPGYELPHQKTINEIHDHVFDMRSTVVHGRLTQLLYRFITGSIETPTHELYRAVYGKASDSRLEPLGVYGTIEKYDWFEVDAKLGYNNPYAQPAFTFHDSWADECVVTVMEKLKIHDGDATVVCRINTAPDNSFDRAAAAPAVYLWEAVEASLK